MEPARGPGPVGRTHPGHREREADILFSRVTLKVPKSVRGAAASRCYPRCSRRLPCRTPSVPKAGRLHLQRSLLRCGTHPHANGSFQVSRANDVFTRSRPAGRFHLLIVASEGCVDASFSRYLKAPNGRTRLPLLFLLLLLPPPPPVLDVCCRERLVPAGGSTYYGRSYPAGEPPVRHIGSLPVSRANAASTRPSLGTTVGETGPPGGPSARLVYMSQRACGGLPLSLRLLLLMLLLLPPPPSPFPPPPISNLPAGPDIA